MAAELPRAAVLRSFSERPFCQATVIPVPRKWAGPGWLMAWFGAVLALI